MISTKHKFIFIHPPKTGGNTIHTVLKPYYHESVRIVSADNRAGKGQGVGIQMKPPGTIGDLSDYSQINKHWEYDTALRQAEMLLGPSVVDMSSTRLISTIRNPWARAASWYTWGERIRDFSSQSNALRFLLWYERNPFGGSARKPCSYWWSGAEPDYVVRMERFGEDLQGLFKFLDIPAPSSLPKTRVNSSRWRQNFPDDSNDKPYRELYRLENGQYCEELIEMIREDHAQDIEFSKKLFENHKYSPGPVGISYDF